MAGWSRCLRTGHAEGRGPSRSKNTAAFGGGQQGVPTCPSAAAWSHWNHESTAHPIRDSANAFRRRAVPGTRACKSRRCRRIWIPPLRCTGGTPRPQPDVDALWRQSPRGCRLVFPVPLGGEKHSLNHGLDARCFHGSSVTRRRPKGKSGRPVALRRTPPYFCCVRVRVLRRSCPFEGIGSIQPWMDARGITVSTSRLFDTPALPA